MMGTVRDVLNFHYVIIKIGVGSRVTWVEMLYGTYICNPVSIICERNEFNPSKIRYCVEFLTNNQLNLIWFIEIKAIHELNEYRDICIFDRNGGFTF